VANSTPIVLFSSSVKMFLVNRDRRLDFPTPESPTSTILNRRSYCGDAGVDVAVQDAGAVEFVLAGVVCGVEEAC